MVGGGPADPILQDPLGWDDAPRPGGALATTGLITMRLPIQAKPVKRPELIQPHTTVDVEHGGGEGSS